MMKYEQNIVSILVLMIGVSCSVIRKNGISDEYRNYKIINGIALDSVLPFQYFKDFLVYRQKQKQQLLLQHPYLKANKVYVYQGPNIFSFCIFSDDENEYMSRVYKVDSTTLTKPVNGIVNLKRKIKLEFLGNIELQDSIIRISRNIRALSGLEWNECDVGYIQKDTIWLIENYDTRKYSYKKKWLAKKYKTNFKLIYQPNLKATRNEGDETNNPYYSIQGSFNVDED